MLIRALLSLAIIAFSVIAALNSSAPAKVGLPAQPKIESFATNTPRTQMIDYTLVFPEGNTSPSMGTSAH